MVYKIDYEEWKLCMEIGESVSDVNGVGIKILSIIKISSETGKTFVYVLGANESDLI